MKESDDRRITPARQARIPGSKSLTNRALLLAAAARGTSVLKAPLVSDDTVAFRHALTGLGVRIERESGDRAWVVAGLGHGPTGSGSVWCEDAGTAARFLPPFAAAGQGDFRFEGTAQLTARPVAPSPRRCGTWAPTSTPSRTDNCRCGCAPPAWRAGSWAWTGSSAANSCPGC